MKGIMRIAGALLAAGSLSLWPTGGVGAARPPIITRTESQVTVLGDGALDIKYSLTFHETEPRTGITTMGRFDPGRKMLDHHIEHEKRVSPVTMRSQGDGYYGVDFGFRTRSGVDYTLHVHYRAPRVLDETTIKGASYRVLEWSPVEWNLGIGEQIVRVILPIQLPASITKPEEVTDAIVDETAIVVDTALVSSFDRWVYYPTPDQAKGTNWLSIYVSKAKVPPQYHFRPKVYVPARYFATPAKATPTAPGPSAQAPTKTVPPLGL